MSQVHNRESPPPRPVNPPPIKRPNLDSVTTINR